LHDLLIWLGWRYAYNANTYEIHDLKNTHKNCKLDYISKKNWKYLRAIDMQVMFADDEADGCRWCMKDQNKG
jgi:hypothetical protein